MKCLGRITAVLLSAAIACSAAGMICCGDSGTICTSEDSILSELDSGVYKVTAGKKKTFTLKMAGVSRITAASSDKSVAKITALSYKNNTVRVTVKGISEGTAVIRIYDKKNKKKVKSITVSVSEETTVTSETDSDKPAITVGSAPADSSSEEKDPEELINEVLKLVNENRAKYGAAPLTLNSTLSEAAQTRAAECGQVFSHTRPDGSSCFTVFEEYDISYSYAAENIAYGYTTAEEVMNGWMNSEGHRKNILNGNYTEIGIGYDPATNSWVQLFLG